MTVFDLNNTTDQEIIDLHLTGLSSRNIAYLVGCSKTKVNDTIKKFLSHKESFKILFIDTETTPDVAVSFKRFKTNITQDHVLQEGGTLLSIAWQHGLNGKVQGERLTKSEALNNEDVRLVAIILEEIEKADIIVGHNIDNFDLPQIKARAVINNFNPPAKVRTIDTLKIARQLKFQSNKLDSLAVALGLERKIETGGIKLWIDCMKGDIEALNKMLKYNKYDVELLVQVYLRLRSFDSFHPNVALLQGKEITEHTCKVCGSTDLGETGKVVTTNTSVYKEYQCNDCGSRMRNKVSSTTSKERKLLLT